MPDGRVWTAGADHDAGRGTGLGWGQQNCASRSTNHGTSVALGAPRSSQHPRWTTGERFRFRTTQATDITRVAMLCTGSCTHGFNPDQRYVSLKFEHAGGDELECHSSSDGNIAPSGTYFIYTINRQGLPSAATTVYVSTTPETDAERAWEALYHGR